MISWYLVKNSSRSHTSFEPQKVGSWFFQGNPRLFQGKSEGEGNNIGVVFKSGITLNQISWGKFFFKIKVPAKMPREKNLIKMDI